MRKIIILALMSISLMACNNDNEKAMQDALNKAGIKISQQDSIIAAQTYRCNYVLTYSVDTTDFLVDHDTLVHFPKDTTHTWYGKLGHVVPLLTYIYHDGYTYLNRSIIRTSKQTTLKFKDKSVVYMDSVLMSIHKTTLSSSNYCMRTDMDTATAVTYIGITRTKKVWRQLVVRSYDLKKDYYNLYNTPKSE